MALTRYVRNDAGVREILRSEKVAAVVKDAADVIADRARGLAPVQSGAYRDSITVTEATHPTRVVAHVGPLVDYGLVVETRQHVLRRSLG